MRSIIRKFLSLSLAVAIAAAPLTAFASEALGDDLASSSTTVNERTELNAGTFWSNTYSDLRQENYVVYSPNMRVKPIVTGGDYTTHLTTVSAAAILADNDTFGAKRKERLDSVSAAVILESFLNWRAHHPDEEPPELVRPEA